MVSIEDFRKLEINVAKILEVNLHPGADRLYLLKIALGAAESKNEATGEVISTPEVREIVAGIRPYYTPEELVGKQALAIAHWVSGIDYHCVKSVSCLSNIVCAIHAFYMNTWV